MRIDAVEYFSAAQERLANAKLLYEKARYISNDRLRRRLKKLKLDRGYSANISTRKTAGVF